MATNAAAAALFAAALPRTPIASTSTSNHPNFNSNNNGPPTAPRGRGSRRGNLNSRGGGRGRGGRNGGASREDAMHIEEEGNGNGTSRGRQGTRHAPMGERVSFIFFQFLVCCCCCFYSRNMDYFIDK